MRRPPSQWGKTWGGGVGRRRSAGKTALWAVFLRRRTSAALFEAQCGGKAREKDNGCCLHHGLWVADPSRYLKAPVCRRKAPAFHSIVCGLCAEGRLRTGRTTWDSHGGSSQRALGRLARRFEHLATKAGPRNWIRHL